MQRSLPFVSKVRIIFPADIAVSVPCAARNSPQLLSLPGTGEVTDWMEIVSVADLSFKPHGAGGLNVQPMHRTTDEKYEVYWALKDHA